MEVFQEGNLRSAERENLAENRNRTANEETESQETEDFPAMSSSKRNGATGQPKDTMEKESGTMALLDGTKPQKDGPWEEQNVKTGHQNVAKLQYHETLSEQDLTKAQQIETTVGVVNGSSTIGEHTRTQGTARLLPRRNFEGDFDELLGIVGEFGTFQWRLFLLFQLPFFSLAMIYFSQIWLVLEPEHWCRVPALEEQGWTPEQIRNLTSPWETRAGQAVRSMCRMYSVDFSRVNPNSWFPSNDTKIVPCQYGWHFDFSLIYPTIVSDLSWVCDDAWKPTFSSVLFFVGSMIGTMVYSELADRYGRLPIIVASHVTSGVTGFASSFSKSLPVFASLRFLYGFGNATVMVQAVLLMTEFVGPSYRSMVMNVPLATSFCAAMVVMPWLAKALYHWKYMAMATSLPLLLAVSYYLLRVPESCRWLQHMGHIDRAIEEMRRIARENGKQVPEDVWAEFTEAARRRRDVELEERHPSMMNMMRLPRLRRRMLLLTAGSGIVYLQFDLIARATEFDVDVYTAQSVLGVTEAPADFLTWLLMETVGRRWSITGSLLGTSVLGAALSALLWQGGLPVVSTTVAFFCRCSATVALNVIITYSMELLPTVVRSRGVGVTGMVANLCTMLSPVILSLSDAGRGLPAAVLAGVALIGAALLCSLPETMGRPLSNTLDEGEQFGSDQRFWQCFCQRPCATLSTEKEEKTGYDNPVVDVESECSHL